MTGRKKQSRKKPVTPVAEAYIDGGDIVIRVPIRNLPGAVELGPLWPHAKHVVNELNAESSTDGPPRVHQLFDAAVAAAIEYGAEGSEWDEEAEA